MKLFKKLSDSGSPTPVRESDFLCNITELKTLAEKSKGLIGAQAPCAVYFKTRWGIHTFGVRFPIDVVIADDNFRIRKIKKSLPPNKFFFWNPRFANIFELQSGTVDSAKFQIGDVFELRS